MEIYVIGLHHTDLVGQQRMPFTLESLKTKKMLCSHTLLSHYHLSDHIDS